MDFAFKAIKCWDRPAPSPIHSLSRQNEASLLRGLGEPGGWDAALAYLKERAERRLQLLGEIDAAQAEALERMTEGRVSFFYPGSLRHGPSKPPPRSR